MMDIPAILTPVLQQPANTVFTGIPFFKSNYNRKITMYVFRKTKIHENKKIRINYFNTNSCCQKF